ncbi:MAG: YheV family putative zinc ribbon protein [Pseudomonadota bacterium]|nr:DNA-binding protein [Pseudomonadales bacterium]MDY6919294.1 YheV family putative zinc ribbon protein [Pseudomonadota bacterium]
MKKRFIAGAKCPQCEQEDKIFIYQQDGEDVSQCNACGYQSVRPKEGADDPWQAPVDGVVKIFDR